MSTKYRVCPSCRGEGKIVNPVLSVWTQNDRADDPEGFESMMRGDFDVACPECGGKRVVTRQDEADFREREQDRRTQLRESGIWPGSPDWY
jgi:DnaJ-class molecular chaperone